MTPSIWPSLFLALLLPTLVALPGCENPCEQAAERLVECLKSYCQDQPEANVCANVERAEASIGAGGECDSESAERARAFLSDDLTCEAIGEMIGWSTTQ